MLSRLVLARFGSCVGEFNRRMREKAGAFVDMRECRVHALVTSSKLHGKDDMQGRSKYTCKGPIQLHGDKESPSSRT